MRAYSHRRRPLLKLRRRQWRQMIAELGRRGAGSSEAGAFLLARRGETRVRRIEYYDDLDPGCLQGNINFAGWAFSKLWDICETEGLTVVADVHTHPGNHVHQSAIDRDNPMISRVGHVALIVPDLAARPVRPREAGVHQYAGDDGWTSWFGSDAAARLSIRRWT